MKAVTASAPAKLNLVLQVGRLEDGYHPLYSIFEALNMRETVRVTPCAGPSHVHTTVQLGPGSKRIEEAINALEPQQNLAVKAGERLLQEAQKRMQQARCAHNQGPRSIGDDGAAALPPGLEFEVLKRVPMAGGMAGGSADAAAALVAVNELLGLKLTMQQLLEIGAELGADVPACLMGGTSLGLRYGDQMTKLGHGQTHHWVMVLVRNGLSTPAVFKTFDTHQRGREKLPTSLRTQDRYKALGPATDLKHLLTNDLQASALEMRPDLARIMTRINHTDALAALVSGSGPTIAVLARDGEHAQQLAQTISEFADVEDCLCTHGPVVGARVETLAGPAATEKPRTDVTATEKSRTDAPATKESQTDPAATEKPCTDAPGPQEPQMLTLARTEE
ncbi:4-(cytidine 5'-diphospho)-2-C-methyl-D-erythritol kinase [Gleimia hominis]|uniref:4-diphosphocytidyl-2-C-methyl-D-erythritol kinase n=1 Tax=Gleimia hominis TaxID=595468 RepID=A0ABU3IA54_9ACTO|nr:4-(cytidine 5'-diphospho)-2-C-methyl-D-erythritol kinase [Gleimia hominis]MDT3767246.1 4-(cytidine 5'-diphospho)-2-C-methyl-D-erythritol kinase [Gleimia hominis]